MKAKVEQLRKLMEKYELFQENDEVGIALKELETEINSYKGWELYKEDFSEDSLETEVLFNNGELRSREIFYKE